MKRSHYTDEQILAISKRAKRDGRSPTCAGRTHHRANVLPLEAEVRRDGAQRDAATETGRGRESTSETDRGGANARHPGAQGGRRKKVVGPIGARRWGGCRSSRRAFERRTLRDCLRDSPFRRRTPMSGPRTKDFGRLTAPSSISSSIAAAESAKEGRRRKTSRKRFAG